VSVETCDETIAQENDQLKLEVKRLEQMVTELVKQAKVQPSDDNHRNMMNKLENDLNVTKQASQQSNKAQPLKKQQKTVEEEKLEYARSAYLNARRPHIKNGKEFIKFTKGSSHQVEQDNKSTNHISNVDSNASYMPYHAFDASYVLMKNKYENVIALYIGSCHKRHNTCVWVPKVLVINMKGPKQVWVLKSKT
jgi:hypothetical protein